VAGTLRPLNRGPIDDDEMVRLIFNMINERTRRIFDEDGGAISPIRWTWTARHGGSA
jgi:twitching motility protein PilT